MTDLIAILQNKHLKPKSKVARIAELLLNSTVSVAQVIKSGTNAPDVTKANCLEALETVTKTHPEFAGAQGIQFAISCLSAKAPRVKLEAARVIGNSIATHPEMAGEAITELLANTENSGTVVRWGSAFALAEIVKLPGENQQNLVDTLRSILLKEEKTSIRKIYERALKGKQIPNSLNASS